MKKLILFVFTFLLSFLTSVNAQDTLIAGLKPFEDLVGHTWKLEAKQLKGGPDIYEEISFSIGLGGRMVIIESKTDIPDDSINGLVPYYLRSIVWQDHPENGPLLNFTQCDYYGEAICGVAGFYDGMLEYNYTTYTSEHSYYMTEQYTSLGANRYEVSIFIITDGNYVEIISGILTLIK